MAKNNSNPAPAAPATEETPVPGTQTNEAPSSEETPAPEAPAPEEEPLPEIVERLLQSVAERAREVFLMHTAEEIYFTSDGTAFIEEQYARQHATFLVSDTVTTVKRSEV